jgi:hypothetical protein
VQTRKADAMKKNNKILDDLCTNIEARAKTAEEQIKKVCMTIQ